MERDALKDTSRVVVKFGTGILTNRSKQIDPRQIEQLVGQVAAQREAGREVIVVSSGAVGAGMGVLNMAKRPTDLSDLQACAAVGQSALMSTYTELFAKHNLQVAQVLLTHDDLEDKDRHLNARNTLVSLLAKGVVPIVNENDAVSYTELKFGDNDWLAALVACLLPADLLVILTTVDGLVENFGKKNPRTIPVVEKIDANIQKLAGGTLSATAVGGMDAKIRAAKMTARTGIPLVIASGKKKRAIANVIDGREEGTFFVSRAGKLKGRKRWIAFSITQRDRYGWTTVPATHFETRAKVCCLPAFRSVSESLPRTTSCVFATCRAQSFRGVSADSTPMKSAPGN